MTVSASKICILRICFDRVVLEAACSPERELPVASGRSGTSRRHRLGRVTSRGPKSDRERAIRSRVLLTA